MGLSAAPIVGVIGFAGVAFAADDPFADLYSDTLVYTQGKVVTKVLVEKNGTWTSTVADGKTDT